ncbi:hypothetical protein [Gayadomonas joobiniege]|uniref:hypothetical protein n=1 Tax=Gayadomonas joobiniege TaxID=1234606 RepID=UPI000375A604|nr:hypothetical protein [Gayadomonas joobiniege]
MKFIGTFLFDKKRWIVRKLTQAALGSLLIFLALLLWFQYENKSRADFAVNSYQTAHQFADVLAQQFNQEVLQADSLNALIEKMLKADLIHSIELADPKGLLLASGSVEETNTQITQIVKPLQNEDGDLNGYLTVQINNQQLNYNQQAWLTDTSSTVRLLFFIIALASLFISRSFFIAPGEL